MTLGKARTVRTATGKASPPTRRTAFGPLEKALLAGKKPRVISFVGSGGKTSLLKALAISILNRGMSVMTTTTTRVRVSEFETADIPPLLSGGEVECRGKNERRADLPDRTGMPPDLSGGSASRSFDNPPFVPIPLKDAKSERMRKLARAGNIPFVYDGKGPRKYNGIRPDEISKFTRGFDVVLVESDGCRGLSLKRLRDHEPPLPPSGIVVLVVGADAWGKRLEDGCFNHEGAIAQCLARKGQCLDAQTIRRILFHPRGFIDAAGKRPLFLALNKSDLNSDSERMARELYHSGVAGVFVTSVRNGVLSTKRLSNGKKSVVGLVLAAGESLRFGALKQAAPFRGTTLLSAVLRNVLGARGLESVLLVLGHRHKAVLRSLGTLARHPRLGIIINYDYHLGMSTSLRAGVRLAGNADAVAIILGDQPGIDSAIITKVVDAYLSSPCKLAFSEVLKKRGHPVILDRELFPLVMTLEGDIGARGIVEENLTYAAVVPVPSASQNDIDIQKDLKRHNSRGKR